MLGGTWILAISSSVTSLLTLPGMPMTRLRGGMSVPSVIRAPRSYDRFRTHMHVVQERGPHPDQTVRLYLAAVQDHAMPHRHMVAHDAGVEVSLNVTDGSVLDVRVMADSNVVHVTPDDCVEPDAGIVSNFNVTDNFGAFCDKYARSQLRRYPVVSV